MDKERIMGVCMTMCPESEIEMRQREGLVHVLETRHGTVGRKEMRAAGDRRKMVKMFSRSAAGRDLLQPDELRPPPVLKKTINYLLSKVVSETEVAWSTVYMFITDRLRSVRQDLIVQQPPPSLSCAILEPIVRFHAYSAYRLCEEPIEVYDPHLNSTHLNETLKQLLICYTLTETSDKEVKDMSATREQMEALYGLLHLGNVDALSRMLSLRPPQRSLLADVLRSSLAHFHNNYVTVCRQLRCLPSLLACVVAIHVPYIRRKALSTMNCAYSSKNLSYPLAQLVPLLLYLDDVEAADECRHYGLSVTESGVNFLKGTFDVNIKEIQPKRLHFIDENLEKITLSDLLLTVCAYGS